MKLKADSATKLFLLLIFGFLFTIGCNNSGSPSEISDQKTMASDKKATEPINIDIQPYSDIPEKYVAYVFKELSKIYPNIQIKKAIVLPQQAYFEPRKRYKADTLIDRLRSVTPAGHVTIGMTNKDISTTKGNIADYGIMGLGYQPGKSCVVSYFRLSKKADVFEQFFKLSIHEHGHTQGLPHCPVKTCFMRDAEGKNHTDEEKEFCPKCKAHLESRGWKF